MNTRNLFVALLSTAVGFALVAGGMAIAEPANEKKPDLTFSLPPGWTEADMKAVAAAGTPGKMHAHLAKGVGEWKGKNTFWMYPGADPVTSESTSKVTPMMDGRFTRIEMAGDMPGVGPYQGYGIYGFDNVSQKFSSTWIDNMGTGMSIGVGELGRDGVTTTWKFTYNCPITKKPAVLGEVEKITGPDTKTLEMFGVDPKGGEEFKMMSIECTRI